nr:MAG: replication associated protein [Cressdnaviricota sp.]
MSIEDANSVTSLLSELTSDEFREPSQYDLNSLCWPPLTPPTVAPFVVDKSRRNRKWCFTVNNFTDEEEEVFKMLPCTYCICGQEKGEEGTPHLQGFVYFRTEKSFNQCSKICPRAHWEIARGSVAQNTAYCSKQMNFWTTGVAPMSQAEKGECEIQRYKRAWDLAVSNVLIDVDADIRIKCYRTLKEIAKDHMSKPSDLEGVCGVWIWGPPGSGKSRMARERYPDSYFKNGNKWWDGYQGEKAVIIDDWGLEHVKLAYHLKIWSDRYAFIAEVKGGAILIRPSWIVVTSNYTIDTCFEDHQTCLALGRRFTVINVV